MQMIAGGLTSTALRLKHAIYNLALFPEIQEKIYNELINVFENKKFTFDKINACHLLKAYVYECARTTSTTDISGGRIVTNKNGIIVEGYNIPYNTIMMNNIYCIDKNNNLYCFGSNLFNKLGLSNNKCEINIIWEPMKSDFFNSKNGIIVKQIQCATNLVVFVDNNGQCYWSGKHFVEIYSVSLNIFHWQKWKNEYNNVKIVQALCADEENDEKALVVMVDSKHKLKVELIGTIESMPYVQIDGLDENTIIDNLLFSLGGIMIVTSKRK
eukprot:136292_1